MEGLVWSFVEGLGSEGGRRTFEVRVTADQLERIGYPRGIACVPEGMAIEVCAQSAGLSIHLGESGFQSFPILARVNRARFLERIPIGEGLTVASVELQRSESGAVFECRVFETATMNLVAEVELLLGFLPFEEMEDGGASARARLETFVLNLTSVNRKIPEPDLGRGKGFQFPP